MINLSVIIAASTACLKNSSEICDLGGLPTTNASQVQLNQIMGIVYSLIGAIGVLMIVIAGIIMITSAGNPQRVASARKTIIYTVIGLVLSLIVTSVIYFVLNNVKA